MALGMGLGVAKQGVICFPCLRGLSVLLCGYAGEIFIAKPNTACRSGQRQSWPCSETILHDSLHQKDDVSCLSLWEVRGAGTGV